MAPKISIVVPVYNAEEYLPAAIESVQKQTMSDFELILVNDGSTDGSGEVCDRYAAQDPRIRVVHQINKGICAARNAGLAVAQGDFVGFMDNDDALEPDTLSDNYGLLMTHDADWVKFGKTEVLIQSGHVLKERKTSFHAAVYEDCQIVDNMMQLRAEDTMTFVWDCYISREVLKKSGVQFDTNFKSGNEDIDFCEQIAPHCRKLVVNPKSYYIHYTRLGISASSKYSEDKIKSYLYILQKSNARYADYGIDGQRTEQDYVYIITKQIVVNVCQKLNDAGKLLSAEQKKEILRRFLQSPEFKRYAAASNGFLFSRSKKLFVYGFLFKKGWFSMLLLADRLSRKLAYWVRGIGVR